MKKRVLSMLLAFILCFSTLPMTAIAQEADAVTEQEADSAEEQEEAEAAAAPEAETSSDKSTTVETPGTEDSTAGEAPDKSVSDSDAGTQDTGADDEKKAAVQKVQALIDALPETVTVENAESVSAQLEAIDEAMAELTEEQREELDMTRLHAISEVLNTPMTVPMTVAEGQHVDHPICGATCTDENNHSIVTEWQPIGSETELKAATEGYYYLTQDIVTTGTWEPNNNVVLCLNGHSIAANGDFGVIEIKGANRQFTLCDCNSSASTHYFIKSVENNLTRWVPCEENTENRISVTGGVITHSVRTSDLGVKVDKNATFTMYGGTICGNKLQGSYNGAGVYVHDSTFNMYGGAIRGNAASWGGGVAALGSTFNMYGGVISDNMVSASAGGVLLSDKSVMNMSGNAQISNNIAPTKWTTSGGGVYIFASTDGEVSNCLYMSDNAKISGNTATSGGAVYVRKNGQVTMSGNAQISNNTATENGGGVYVENSTFKIAGGAPRVCDNLCQDVQNNVYLATGNAIRISKLSTFTGKIGVSTQDTPTGSNLVTVAAAAVESGAVGSLTEEYVDHISSDKENLYPVLVNGEVKLSATVPHRHPVCGETCGDSGKHSNQTWIGVSRLSDIKSSGNYYLTDNVTLDETWNCNISVNLCLNGKTITGAAGEETIRVAKGTTLTITDCQNEVGKITHAQDNIGRGIMSLGTLILYNGEITKNQIAKGSGAGVYVDGGNFYMYKGSISDNKVTINGNGGGVYAKDSTNFVISGGSIDSNHAPSSGGGIYYESTISKSVKFNISGGNIVRNTAVTSWNPTGFISLCLNGHSITANGNFDAITVGSEDSSTAGDLHVCDCTGNGKITHAEDKTGRGVYVHPRSSFHLWGGSITGNSTNDCGGVYLNGGFGYLSGGSITNNSANEGGGVAIRTASFHNPDTQNSRISGYFYMYGGTITGNTATNGGGVAVKDKTSFRTFGGSVIGNTATANGGGVYVESSTANMSVDGTADHTGDVNITGNKDAKGNDSNVYLPGGTNISIGQNVLHNIRIGVTLEKLPAEGNFVKFVEAATGVTLTDKIAGGFTIDNNSSNTYSVQNIDNSLYVVNGALHKHAICGASCSHETKHDDVLWTPLTYNADTQKMMCGGTIVSSSNGTKGMEYVLPTGNYYLLDNITFTGTIKISGDVNLCLNGKCITNLAQNYASTIAVLARGNLTLCDHEDGTITSKDQKSYGVQFKAYNGIPKFTMYGGTITGTDAGVCQDASAGVFNMYGGAITGNRVGADIPAEITMTVGGTARIIGNTKKDVFLYEKDENSKSIIHIDPSLTNAASIGVATTNSPRPKAPVQIATGATGLVDYTKIFKPDNTDRGYMVIKDEQGNLYLSTHQHSWKYKPGADGKSITATCVNTTNCPNIDGGSVTIKAPEENTLIYDGSNKTAILENKLLTGEKDPTISYTVGNGQGATLPDGSYPTNVGAYTASITVGGVTASVTYEIQKADPAAKNFVFTAPGSLTYDGTAKTADIKTATNITGMGDVMVKYYQGETEVQPMNAGEYKVKISVTDGTNFNAASDLTDENWAFTITPIITEPTVELSGNTTYTYTGERITPDVTVTIDGRPLTKGTDYTIIYGDNVNAGTNAGSVTVKAKGNYGFADVVKKFAIEKADPKLNFEKPAVTTSYGTNPANNELTNKGDGAVNYQSSDNSVVTVNEKGEVTVVGVGETTITATAAETTNYKVGTASYKLTVNKARVHIVQATVANKDYDGNVNADVTGVVFANEADVRIDGRVAGTDYTVTGAFQSENAGKQDAEVTVKLLGEFASHYELTGGIYKTRATITAKPISIAIALTQDRSYERNNTSVTILEVTFKDSTNTLVATLTSSDYTATGKMVNANVGTDKKVTVTVTLQGKAADNYKLVSNMTTAKVAITQAKGGVLQEENLKQKFSDRKQKTFTPDYTGLPAGETWTYSISEAQTSGSAKVEPAMINTAGKITYRLTAGAENDTICWTVTISNPNYEKFTKDLVLTLTAKEPQETLRITGDNTVAYGQKLLLSTVGGSGTGEITYRVDAGSTGNATINQNGVLTPVKVGSVVITATKAGDIDYSEITSAPFVIMITRAATSGEPKYNKITTGGMTLADAGLTLAGSTIHPADGTLEWIDDAGVLPNDTAVEMNKTYKWRFIPADTNYEILTGEIELYHVDAPAVTAQPKSVSVTVGDTATFEVTATGTDVTYQWQIDRNDGNGFVNITGATGATYTIGVTDRDCNGFKYRCVLSNAAGSVTTDTVVLTVQYQIIEGANGSWNQNTDGRSLKIRGNGEYSKFQNVKVDGNIIDSKNYTVSEGSTIIELHADYLKTLSEGSHTFEIVWTDGAAGTSFTVARNTSGSNNTGSNNTGNNDNNDSTDNSAAAAPTAAATAQELDKVPATGDPLGIWLMLFAISLTGLAGMLARRKKN